MRDKTPKFKLNIAIKIWLWVLVTVLSVFLNMAAIVWSKVNEETAEHIEHEINENVSSFQRYFDFEIQDLSALGNWLTHQRRFVELIKAHDSAALSSYLLPGIRASAIDVILVADQKGAILSHITEERPIMQGGNILEQPGIKEALIGVSSHGIEIDAYSRPQGRIILPVYDDEQNPPIAVLILGLYLDGEFLRDLTKIYPDMAVMFAQKERITMSTLTVIQSKTPESHSPPVEVTLAEKQNRETNFLMLETNKGLYLFKFSPLQAPDQTTIGMYGIGFSYDEMTRGRQNWLAILGLSFAVSLFIVFIAGYWLTQTLVSPLRKLQSATQTIARGDWSQPIELPNRHDEFAGLAQQLDHIRQQLQQSAYTATLEKNRAAATLHMMKAAVVTSDNQASITYVSPAAEHILRETEATLVGHNWPKLFIGQDQLTPEQLPTLPLHNGHEIVISERTRLHAHPHVVLDITSTAIEIEHQRIGFVHILHDMTEREQFVLDKDAFILNVAHELRGPLASLRVSIELLCEDYAVMSKQEMRLVLRVLQRGTVKFQVLVENLIDIGSIQAGRFRISPVPTELDQLLDDALIQIDPLLKAREQVLDVQLNRSDSYLVMADRTRIVQVLINLLHNAGKYGPVGQPITVAVSKTERLVMVEITDRGRGIPPTEQTHIFERFYRAKQMAEEGVGIGLGLALAREIIEAHGTQIGLRSVPNDSTTFWFSLPRA